MPNITSKFGNKATCDECSKKVPSNAIFHFICRDPKIADDIGVALCPECTRKMKAELAKKTSLVHNKKEKGLWMPDAQNPTGLRS